jgi:hypothetical protein
MTANKVGRNDPCPCGSGKKYKYCCLRKDQRQRRQRVSSSRRRPDPQLDDLRRQVDQISRQLEQHLPDDETQELREQIRDVESMARYAAMEDEIDAAVQSLEAHRVDAEKMMADPEAAMTRALQLFSEEPFADLRFGPDELKRAFEVVGYPSPGWGPLSDEDMEIMVRAAIQLAGDKTQRFYLSRRLMMTLPDYVETGRYLDACLIEYSAYRLIETPEESNPFMFVMVQLALEAWMERMENQQRELMEELGLEALAPVGSNALDMEAKFEELMAEPRKRAQMEAFYEAHPELRDQATADLIHLERKALKLLERDDAEQLMLSPEEVAPWLPVLIERLGPTLVQFQEAARQEEQPDPKAVREMQGTVVEMSREMAAEVFTPQRIDQLANELKDYRRSLIEAGEREAAMWAYGALASLQSDTPPANIGILCGICFASLRSALVAADEPTEEDEERST